MFGAPNKTVDVFVVDTTGGQEALRITAQLRAAGISADRAFENRSMKSQMKGADRSGAPLAIIVGSNELEAGQVVIRPLRGEDAQRSVARDTLVSEVIQALQTAPKEATQ